ncbi:putative transmembrane protein [Sesbania bispinosa]|nr:putative transmembrane protein [Sesbania bispinosa]
MSLNSTCREVSWEAPILGSIAINIDGSVIAGVAGYGGLFARMMGAGVVFLVILDNLTS